MTGDLEIQYSPELRNQRCLWEWETCCWWWLNIVSLYVTSIHLLWQFDRDKLSSPTCWVPGGLVFKEKNVISWHFSRLSYYSTGRRVWGWSTSLFLSKHGTRNPTRHRRDGFSSFSRRVLHKLTNETTLKDVVRLRAFKDTFKVICRNTT